MHHVRRMQRYTEAVQHLSKALTLNPYYANAHNNLGAALQLQGRIEEAIEQFSAALKINPAYKSARFNLEKSLKALNN